MNIDADLETRHVNPRTEWFLHPAVLECPILTYLLPDFITKCLGLCCGSQNQMPNVLTISQCLGLTFIAIFMHLSVYLHELHRKFVTWRRSYHCDALVEHRAMVHSPDEDVSRPSQVVATAPRPVDVAPQARDTPPATSSQAHHL